MKEKTSKLGENRLINFKKFTDERGTLVPIESKLDIPFKLKRVFYIYDLNVLSKRGIHAHINTDQIIIAINGSFELTIFDKNLIEEKYLMDSPEIGFFQEKMIWAEMTNFSKDCIILVLANNYFDEKDYITNKENFKQVHEM